MLTRLLQLTHLQLPSPRTQSSPPPWWEREQAASSPCAPADLKGAWVRGGARNVYTCGVCVCVCVYTILVSRSPAYPRFRGAGKKRPESEGRALKAIGCPLLGSSAALAPAFNSSRPRAPLARKDKLLDAMARRTQSLSTLLPASMVNSHKPGKKLSTVS